MTPRLVLRSMTVDDLIASGDENARILKQFYERFGRMNYPSLVDALAWGALERGDMVEMAPRTNDAEPPPFLEPRHGHRA